LTSAFRADPELLVLLFRNLAINAVTYNQRDPVEIEADARVDPDGSLEIRFRDNGVGLAPDERERIFAEFYRGRHGAMARGSGLGLALCRRIAALHGGTIAVAESSREGTSFHLRSPGV